MKELWIVSVGSGEYENYFEHPMCACSTREQADAVIDACESADKRHGITGNDYNGQVCISRQPRRLANVRTGLSNMLPNS